MTNEQIISGFLQTAYSDEKLAALLAHAEDGRLSYESCCCFAGIPRAVHALRGRNIYEDNEHWGLVDTEQEAAASTAFLMFADDDAERRAKLIPLIKTEIARRDRERTESVESESLPPTLVTLGVNG